MTARHVCSGRWPGVWIARRTTLAELQLQTVLERVVRVLGLCRGMDRHRDTALEREAAVARKMVGVRVRLDHANDLDLVLRRHLEHRLDRVRRIDDRRDACFLAPDQIRRTAEVVVQELLEQHEI